MRRIVIPEPRKIQFQDVPKPKRKANDALLKIRYVGICGTDLHTYRGANLLVKYPVVPGHELCCEVIESKEKLSPGDVVVVEPLLPCNRCYPCRLGRYNCCESLRVLGVHTDGGMAEEIVLPLDLLYQLPQGADPSCGPLVETLSIGYHACNRGRVESGDDVLVIGAGPIGLGTALIAKERGARVAIVDKLESRVRLSKELGVDFCYKADEEMEPQIIRKFGCRPSVVIEAVGDPRTLELGLQIVSAAGRVVFVGWTAESPKWRPDLFLKKELELLGSRNSRGVFPEVIDFYSRNQNTLKRLVTHRFRMDQIEDAMNLMDTSGTEAMKVIMEW